MLLGFCSDSHDHVENIRKAVTLFKKEGIHQVIHAGDYCSPFTIPLFDGLNLHGIFGNNDGDHYLLMKKFDEIGAHLHGEFYRFEVGDIRFAVYHGTYPEITESLECSGLYDVVVSGHTHQVKEIEIGNTLSINPGSLNGFNEKATFAIYDTESKTVQIKTIDEN
ncbi:MAG: metallophosphoesterase [Balneolaceae bacterium]